MKTKLIKKLLYVTGLIIWTVHTMSGPFTAEARTSLWVNIIQKNFFRGSNRPESQYDSFTWILSYTILILYSAASSFSSSFSWFNPRDLSKIREIKTSIGLVGLKRGSVSPLTSNDYYSGRTAPLTSKRCILYIYSTNIGTEYFKHGIYFPFFPLKNAVCFIILTYLVPVLFVFYIQNVLKLKK